MLSESLRGVLAQRLLRQPDGRGRALALEVLVGTPAVAALVREKQTFQLSSVIQTGRKEGMQSMYETLFTLVREGKVLAPDAAPHLSNHELSGQLEKLEPASSRREAA